MAIMPLDLTILRKCSKVQVRKWGTGPQSSQLSSNDALPSVATVTPQTLPELQKPKTSDDLFGKYDPTQYFTKMVNSDGNMGFVIRGTGGQLLSPGKNHPVAQETHDENYGEVSKAQPGDYDVLAFNGFSPEPLPGFGNTRVSIEQGMVTVINVPIGFARVRWTAFTDVEYGPALLATGSSRIVGMMSCGGKKSTDWKELSAAPGDYRVGLFGCFGGYTLDHRYPKIVNVTLKGGETTEIVMSATALSR